MRIVGYTYEAACYCPDCTARDWTEARLSHLPGERDEHSLFMTMFDREGNQVHPVFTTDESAADLYCDRCLAHLLA